MHIYIYIYIVKTDRRPRRLPPEHAVGSTASRQRRECCFRLLLGYGLAMGWLWRGYGEAMEAIGSYLCSVLGGSVVRAIGPSCYSRVWLGSYRCLRRKHSFFASHGLAAQLQKLLSSTPLYETVLFLRALALQHRSSPLSTNILNTKMPASPPAPSPRYSGKSLPT